MRFFYRVGDLIRPVDGSGYRGRIIYISKEDDIVKHQCLMTDRVYEKGYIGFCNKYCAIEDYSSRYGEVGK